MAILDASELQHLSVNIQYPGKGNHREDLFRSGNNLGAFKFTINRILPPIRTLELHGYSVGLGLQDELEHRLQVSSLRDLTLNPGPHSDLYLFLETLMKGGNLCFKMLDIYKRALCGSLIHSESRVILRRFLRSFQGLKEFVMRGHNTLPYRSVVDAITWLGDTLETLVLYDPDGTPPTLQRFAQPLRVTAEIVQILYVTCTSLRTLTLYLHFGTDVALQQSFQRFQALEELTIYSPLRRRARECLELIVDYAYVHSLAVQLRSPLLREVTLHVGQETPRASPDSIKWENEHRMVWHIEYPHFDNRDMSITIWESVR
ncbi:MAG: hypothetical protein ASARMPREDX12_009417 [Alectoria sarmentosa]|nr:MAG: hypothetical protein ASARMPREDX12_009417 [Alectoria sarmentosa]